MQINRVPSPLITYFQVPMGPVSLRSVALKRVLLLSGLDYVSVEGCGAELVGNALSFVAATA